MSELTAQVIVVFVLAAIPFALGFVGWQIYKAFEKEEAEVDDVFDPNRNGHRPA